MSRVIVFDLDDTLFSEHDYVKSGFQAVSVYLKDQYEIQNFFSVAWKLFKSGVRGDVFNRALTELGMGSEATLISTLVNVYREHDPDIKLFADGVWALNYFSDQVPLALISDGYLVAQQKKAEALGVAKFFKEMYFTDQWGREYWKPSSFVFEKVESRFGVSGEDCVYIADNPKKDFISPNKMGWLSVRVKRKGSEYQTQTVPEGGEAKIVISDLYSLKTLGIVT